MWHWSDKEIGRDYKFFLINLGHEDLGNYYKLNFAMMQYHKYSLTEIENMIPFEREVYVHQLVKYLEEEKARQEQLAAQRKR